MSAPKALEAKERALRDVIKSYESVVIGFSGGVDSSFLAYVAVDELGPERVLAVTGRSPAYPEVQHDMAVRVARSVDLPHVEVETHELDQPDYAANSPDRCYFCKVELYQRLLRLMRERGLKVVLDGSNADDLDDHRPGLAAARELGVRSPLQEVGLIKAEIRTLSKRAGLPTWDIPASPCLASRIAYGLEVTPGRLRAIEEAEERLRELHDWRELRVRDHGELARLEVAPQDIESLTNARLRTSVIQALKQAGFSRGALDLQGYRRGALNEPLSRSAS